MWLFYGYLRGVVMLWIFKVCSYVMGICRCVVMLLVFKVCGYVMGI